MNLRRLLPTAFVVAALLGLSISSASAATVSPDVWAPKFCTAVTDWQATIQQKADSLTTALDSVDANAQSPQEVLSTARDQISSFLGDMVDATKQAASEIKSAGNPSSPNGAKIEAVFVKGFQAIAKEFAKAQSSAKKLSTDSVTAFKTKGKQLGQALSDSSDTLSKGFSSIGKLDKGKKLEAAVKAAPECAALSS
jgi:hypothetical protein